MGNRSPEISISFSISGRDFDPNECTSAIGLAPTETWRQKRRHLQSRTDLANTAWIIASPWTERDSIDEAVLTMVEDILPYQQGVVEYSRKRGLSVVLNCSVRIWSDAPLYTLRLHTMKGLVALCAEFGLDIYDYRDRSENG
jgi:hypothetical protein